MDSYALCNDGCGLGEWSIFTVRVNRMNKKKPLCLPSDRNYNGWRFTHRKGKLCTSTHMPYRNKCGTRRQAVLGVRHYVKVIGL